MLAAKTCVKTISHVRSVSLHLAERNLLSRLQISATIKDFKLIKDDIIFLSEYVTNKVSAHSTETLQNTLYAFKVTTGVDGQR